MDQPVDVRSQMDRIYRELSPAEIPWNLEQPPRALVELVESGRVAPCDTVDLGCGAGHYAVWLAQQGFSVTGLDLSTTAVALAEALARDLGVACRFLACDLLAPLPDLEARFDFAFDWEVLHHVFPDDRARFAATVHRLLRPGGTYLSVCFAEDDPGLPGSGKFRHTPLGTVLYLSSEREVRDLFEPLYVVESLGTIDVAGKRGPHRAVRALLTKRT
jgi:SAM-dependent methyltransferase